MLCAPLVRSEFTGVMLLMIDSAICGQMKSERSCQIVVNFKYMDMVWRLW